MKFRSKIQAKIFELGVTKLAKELKLSRLTIKRWASNKSSPHELLIPSILEQMEKIK